MPLPATQAAAVLVVEDEVLIRMAIVDSLEQSGFVVYEAANADAAIGLLERHDDIRVLFTDVDMPGSMDGLKLAAAVRDRWPPIKIVVTSGQLKVEPWQLPAEGRFVPKPYDATQVATVLHEMVGN
jgi:CheY-like chemotaxis protein